MKRVAAKNEGDPKSYYNQAYPGNYGSQFTKSTGKKEPKDADKKFQYEAPKKEYSTKGHKMDQNAGDAKSQFSAVSKSWKDQEKGWLDVAKASQKIINTRFAKFQKALETSGESLYKGLTSHPLKEALYDNFCNAGFDADTAHYIVENSFDEGAEGYHEALLKEAKVNFFLPPKSFAKKAAEMAERTKTANEFVGEAASFSEQEVPSVEGASTEEQVPATPEQVPATEEVAPATSEELPASCDCGNDNCNCKSEEQVPATPEAII